MTKQAAIQYVRDCDEDSSIDDDDLVAVFEALYGYAPDAHDRREGLWSLCCAVVFDDEDRA